MVKNNTIRIEKFTIREAPDLAELALSIRTRVFVVEQKVDPALEYEFEEESHHYLLFLDNKPVVAARWRETDEGIKLERFATLKEYRNKGLGACILKEIMNDILPFGTPVYLHSQLKAVPFYERWGFEKSGGIFWEANIPHYLMHYWPVTTK
jgi:predicted GNAT family N-acyltransferase